MRIRRYPLRKVERSFCERVRLHSGQERIWEEVSSRRFVSLVCGRRFGKTYLLSRLVVLGLLSGKRMWWVAPKHALCRLGFEYVCRLVRSLPAGVRRLVRRKRSAPYRVKLGEGVVDFYTSGSPDSLQGAGNDLVVFDECASEANGLEIVEQYIMPTLLDRQGRLICASTPKGKNWFWEFSERSEVWTVHATTYDNPLMDRADIDAMRERMGEVLFRQEILAEFVEEFGKFWAGLEIQESDVEASEFDVCGLDWGIASPFAAVFLKQDSEGVVHVVGEIYGSGLDADEQARLVLSMPRSRRYVADPSTPEHVLEIWRKSGLTGVKPGSRDRVGGWQMIRVMLREGRLRVHPRCFHLLREFSEAEIDSRNASDLVGDDHALDALRYAVLAMPVPKREREQLSVEAMLRVRAQQSYIRSVRRSWR